MNAVGTLNLLEADPAARAGAPFRPHEHEQGLRRRARTRIALKELPTRWDYADPAYAGGIAEDFSIDQCKH